MANAPAASALNTNPGAAPAAKPAAAPAAKPAAAAAAPAAKPAAAAPKPPIAPEVTPESAREYLKGFVIDPANLDALEDDKVLELHGNYRQKYGTPGTWPDDWREQIAGDDEKILKRLQRYGSVRDVSNALIAAQNRISSGELRSVLKEGATEDEVKAWRAENGIPEAPEGYDLTLPNGVVFGDEDKPFIEDFLKSAAHPANLHPNQVKSVLAWYHADRERQIEQMAAKDQEDARKTSDELHAEWGNNFRGESNGIMALLDSAPAGVKEKIMGARGPDDVALFNDAQVLRWLSSIVHEVNPHATTLPIGEGGIEATITTEMAQIEKLMKDKNSAYFKGKMVTKNGVEDTEMAHRYRELIEAQERVAKKKAA